MKTPKVTPQDFLIITNPKDMKKPSARLMAASYAAKFRRKKRHRPVSTQPGATLDSFLLWRFGNVLAKPYLRKQASNSCQHEESISQQHVVEAEGKVCHVPASLNPGVSLQHCKSVSHS
jgi:hypothetical protein